MSENLPVETRRQRLYSVIKANEAMVNHTLLPIWNDLDQLPLPIKFGIRGAITFIRKSEGIDIEKNPVILLYMIIKSMPDDIFDEFWDKIKPVVPWIDNGTIQTDTKTE